ncbi:MAG: glycosyltransferase, partial [Candidatus Promineifilaceae bacterium]
EEDDWPNVTVQLPIYNELSVVERLIDAVVQLDYPADKLQIQVLDDSTDGTTALAAQRVAVHQQRGINISLTHRENRAGYKAGALAEGMISAEGEFIAIFDADFVPNPSFLQETIPSFLDKPQLGNVQSRWTYLNANDSSLTTAEAIALDKQFTSEKSVRSQARLFPKFNGSGGVWRRSCLDDAGGWHMDTLCEDLCLSTRAILNGWEFEYLYDVETPSELPTTIGAYKVQQSRWATGGVQCFIKYFRDLVAEREMRWFARIYALIAMGAHFTNVWFIGLILLQVPILYYQVQLPAYLSIFTIFALSHPLLLVLGQRVLHRSDRRRFQHIPTMLLLATGISLYQAWAVFKGLFGGWRTKTYEFVRTPKGNRSQTANQLKLNSFILLEIAMTLYVLFGIWVAWQSREFGSLFLLLLTFSGFSYVVGLGIQERIIYRTKSLS